MNKRQLYCTSDSESDASEFLRDGNKDAIEDINTSLLMHNVSAVKLHGQPLHQKVKLAKQKITIAAQNLQASFSAAGIDQ